MHSLRNYFKSIPKQTVMLVAMLFLIFISPMLTKTALSPYLTTISFFLIFVSMFVIIEKKSIILKVLIPISLVFILLLPYFDNAYFQYSTYLFSSMVFIYTTGLMLVQISHAKRVDSTMIIEAIIGYLLIGLVLFLLNEAVLVKYPDAFTKSGLGMSDIIYFSYITLTTIGYGDISPNMPITKSIALLGGISGQLYLTIVIAFIVGKFSSLKKKS